MDMRVTQHSGRVGSAKHNDRTFDVKKAKNIDSEKTKENSYWKLYGDTDFKETELKYYKEHYSEALKLSNEKKIKQRHREKVRTINDVYNNKNTRPEELILQIGDKDSNIDKNIFEKCISDYLKELEKWNSENGRHMHVLSIASHFDETSPHLHLRRVWDYKDENGNLQINQNKALEAAGVEPPDPTKPLSRYNNRKMTFDAMMREKWLDICEKNGLEIEREARPNRKAKDLTQYKKSEIAKDFERINALEKNVKDFVNDTLNDLMIMTDKNKSTSEHVKAHTSFVKKANDFIKNNQEYHYNIKTSDEEDNKLKDWKNMSEARRDEEETKAYLKEVHI